MVYRNAEGVIQKMDIKLNPDFWDCECKEFFIHSKEVFSCLRCGVLCEDQPDSIDSEIPVEMKKSVTHCKIRRM